MVVVVTPGDDTALAVWANSQPGPTTFHGMALASFCTPAAGGRSRDVEGELEAAVPEPDELLAEGLEEHPASVPAVKQISPTTAHRVPIRPIQRRPRPVPVRSSTDKGHLFFMSVTRPYRAVGDQRRISHVRWNVEGCPRW
jgi:hypothetical protein